MELPIQMKSASEMYDYSCKNGFGKGLGNAGLKSFELIQRRMEADEVAFLTFIALHRFHSMSSHQRNFAYAFTNKHLLMGQVRSFGRTRFESVSLNEIGNLAFDTEANIAVMKIVMAEATIQVGMSQEMGNALSKKLTELLPLIQSLAKELEGA